jgi:hypothetical protein
MSWPLTLLDPITQLGHLMQTLFLLMLLGILMLMGYSLLAINPPDPESSDGSSQQDWLHKN